MMMMIRRWLLLPTAMMTTMVVVWNAVAGSLWISSASAFQPIPQHRTTVVVAPARTTGAFHPTRIPARWDDNDEEGDNDDDSSSADLFQKRFANRKSDSSGYRPPARPSYSSGNNNNRRSSSSSSSSYSSRGGNNGGGDRHHGYERDISRDTSNIDEAMVSRLLTERVEAKRQQDYDTADAIRDKLASEYGVGVFDKDRTWRTGYSKNASADQHRNNNNNNGGGGRYGGGDRGGEGYGDRRGGGGSRFGGDRGASRFGGERGGGGRFSDRGGGGGGGGGRFGGDRFRNDRGGDRFGSNDRDNSRRPQRNVRDFGPTGHDYNLSADAGPIQSDLSREEIDALLAQRLQAKFSRNFDEADMIQRQLFEAGVKIHDGRKEWRADGQSYGLIDGRNNRNDRGNQQQRPERPGREKGPYEMAPGSDEYREEDLDEIVQLVAEYDEAKRSRRFEIADDIREQLLKVYKIYLNDRLRQWSVGDKFGGGCDNDNGPPTSYKMSLMSQLTDDVVYIQKQVDARVHAKRTRDYVKADTIREDLFQNYQVTIDDRLGEWSVGGAFPGLPAKRDKNSYIRVGSGGNLSEEDVATIEQLVRDRAQAKGNKDYDRADAIKDQLYEQYKVQVRDKDKEWIVIADGYTFVGTDESKSNLDDATLAYILQRLEERNEYKKNRNWPEADEIRNELEEKYLVNIDDKTFEWTIGQQQPGTSRDSAGRLMGNRGAPVVPANGAVQYTFKRPSSVTGDDDDDDESSSTTANGYAVALEEGDDDEEDDYDDDDDDEEDWEKDANDGPVNDVAVHTADNNKTTKEVTGGQAGQEEDLSSLTVVELKAKLKEAGLPVSGRKAELVERLLSKA